MTDVVLAEERYSHVLFRRGGQHLLTYVSGGVFVVDRTVVLPPDLAESLTKSPADLKAWFKTSLLERSRRGLESAAVVWPA